MEGVDLFSHASVDKYAAAVRKAESQGINVRALWLCNPHNPLGISYEKGASQGVGDTDKAQGQCYPREVLKGYMGFCQEHHIHLISDEIYGLSVFDINDSAAVPFTSVLSIDPTELIDLNLLHVFYGMSKV